MGFLLNTIKAPFKIASGVLEGVKDNVNTIKCPEEKSDGEIVLTMWTLGLNNVAKRTFEKTKEALDDISKSDKLV